MSLLENKHSDIESVFQSLSEGLPEYILKTYKKEHGGDYLMQLQAATRGEARGYLNDEEAIVRQFDVHSWLKAIVNNTRLFANDIGFYDRDRCKSFDELNGINNASELLSFRNLYAHKRIATELSDHDYMRAAESASRLLYAIGAKKEARIAKGIWRQMGQRLYGDDPTAKAALEHAVAAARQDKSKAEADLDNRMRELKASRQQTIELRKALAIVKRTNGRGIERENAFKQKLAKAKTKAEKQANTLTTKLDAANRRRKTAEEETQSLQQELKHARDDLRAARERENALLDLVKQNEIKKIAAQSADKSRAMSLIADPQPKRQSRDLYRGADLRDRDLSGQDLSHHDLSGANLTGANLEGANLTKVNLRDADLTRANMKDATLSGTRLMGATLDGSIWPDGRRWSQGLNTGPFLR